MHAIIQTKNNNTSRAKKPNTITLLVNDSTSIPKKHQSNQSNNTNSSGSKKIAEETKKFHFLECPCEQPMETYIYMHNNYTKNTVKTATIKEEAVQCTKATTRDILVT